VLNFLADRAWLEKHEIPPESDRFYFYMRMWSV